ncbi:chitinase 11 [Oryza glaberrima]|uniref:chitinase n=2 Tax=Oryza TaxID=4527 RepID=A0A0D9Z1P5_9ORYZ|nr:chitinase 11 [Oryza glaberrima]
MRRLLALAGATLLIAAAGGASGQQAGVGSIITRAMFESMLSHRGDQGCQGAFYTYDAFIKAAGDFPRFGTTGNDETRRRELAAFFGQTSHETTGGWATAPDGPFAWGYCRVNEITPSDPPYYGRGPIQLTHKYNYQLAGDALGLDLVNNPDLVSSDPVVAFRTAIWFWMTAQSPKPSCHDVITNQWTPSGDDRSSGRLPGYGMATNIINGGEECGKGYSTDNAKDRVGYYKRYCDMFRVGYGDNIACRDQKPYGGG